MRLEINLVIFTILLTLLPCSICNKSNNPVVPAPCPIEFLMLDTSSLPEGWLAGKPRERSAPTRWGIEKLGVTFMSDSAPGVNLQHVHRGENYKRTSDGYFEFMTSWFHTNEGNTEWYLPLEFPYKNTIADRYHFRCATVKHNGIEFCHFVGQYGVYITEIQTVMSPSMTYDDLAYILQTIDTKMTQCLGK